MTKKVMGVVLTTLYPDLLFSHTLTDESLQEISLVKDYIKFLINFQKYSSEDIDKATNILSDYGFDFDYMEGVYEIKEGESVPYNRIINDCALIDSDLPYYINVEDDMIYSSDCPKRGQIRSSRAYLISMIYMLTHPKCGVMNLRPEGTRLTPGSSTVYPISNKIPHHYTTGSGLLGINMKEYSLSKQGIFMPDYSLDTTGGWHENVFVQYRIFHGLYGARLSRAYLVHDTAGKLSKGRKLGWVNRKFMMKMGNLGLFTSDSKSYYNPENLSIHFDYPDTFDEEFASYADYTDSELKEMLENLL